MNANQNQVLVPRTSLLRNACRAAMRPSLIVVVANSGNSDSDMAAWQPSEGPGVTPESLDPMTTAAQPGL
ncbi:hypothetical protein D3C73_1309200 [compost metagenome]